MGLLGSIKQESLLSLTDSISVALHLHHVYPLESSGQEASSLAQCPPGIAAAKPRPKYSCFFSEEWMLLEEFWRNTAERGAESRHGWGSQGQRNRTGFRLHSLTLKMVFPLVFPELSEPPSTMIIYREYKYLQLFNPSIFLMSSLVKLAFPISHSVSLYIMVYYNIREKSRIMSTEVLSRWYNLKREKLTLHPLVSSQSQLFIGN